MGCYCFRLADVSVDGLHRILHNLPGQLHIFCMSQAAPSFESQQAPRNGLLEEQRQPCLYLLLALFSPGPAPGSQCRVLDGV